MPTPNTDHLTTNPEYIDLLNFLIERTGNVKSPMNKKHLIRGFKEKNGAAQTVDCLKHRIKQLRTWIHGFEHIDTNTKVKMLFALSASVNTDFLKELKKNALVEVDEKKRITYCKANDGSFELKGDHSKSAKMKTVNLESKRNYRKLISDYFENKDNVDAIQKIKEEKEMWNLIEFITQKCGAADSPLSVCQLTKGFNNHFGISRSAETIRTRVKVYCNEIQGIGSLDTLTKVKHLFCLSAKLDLDFLQELRKDASVEADHLNRITKYTANNGRFSLQGDHSLSARNKTAQLESKRSLRSMIIDYFETKDDADAVPSNKEEKEMGNLIEFITEKCETIVSPLNIRQLAKEFIAHFEILRSLQTIENRIKVFGREIQKIEFLDTPSKVKQLFCLSATLDSDYLKELRMDAVVEVDNLNRITKYTANDGRLTLYGEHSLSAKRKLARNEWKMNKKAVKKHCVSGGDEGEESDNENGYSEDDSDEYSSEEFDSEVDSDEENDHVKKAEDLMEQPKETNGFDTKTRVRNRSEMSIDNSFDFDPPTKGLYRSEEIETREFVEEATNPEITESAVIKTRSGRLSKKRHLDSNFSYDLANSSSSGGLMSSSSSYSKPAKHFHPLTERSHVSKAIAMKEGDGMKRKKRNNYTSGSISSKRARSSSNNSIRPNGLDDYDKNYIIDDEVKLEPFRGSIQEDLNDFKEDEDIQQIPKPLQAHDEHNQTEGVPIKVEPEELKIVENPTEDVKPEIAQAHDEHKELIEIPIKLEHEEPVEVKPETFHNSKTKFFEAMQSLIICLDTPSLSEIQLKIHQKIQKLGGPNEVILNNEIVVFIELLISRMANHSVENPSKNVESVNFSNFLCYLKAAILNSKISGVEGLVKNISKRIEESQIKRISMGYVQNALLATLDIDGL
ncbi:unnamed protein product [Caenorhabditis brenneri]